MKSNQLPKELHIFEVYCWGAININMSPSNKGQIINILRDDKRSKKICAYRGIKELFKELFKDINGNTPNNYKFRIREDFIKWEFTERQWNGKEHRWVGVLPYRQLY
jgi:hypothetical protein